MDINEFKIKSQEVGFQEMIFISEPNEITIDKFLDYKVLGLDLKIHLAEILITRSFPPTGGVYMPANVNWLIDGFLQEYKIHPDQHWNTGHIEQAIRMIISSDNSQNIIATAFMYTIIEGYGRQKLGFISTEYDFFDKRREEYTKLAINHIFTKIRKINKPISDSINRIDTLSKNRFRQSSIKEDRFIKVRILDRLTFYRNNMLHGKLYPPDQGQYLVLLYILFYWNDMKEKQVDSAI